MTPTTPAHSPDPGPSLGEPARDGVECDSPIESDTLVEEISIDGMCGVY